MKKSTALLVVITIAIAAVLVYRTLTSRPDVVQDGYTPLRVQLQWFDGAQFTGLYVANEMGYFKEAGLSVELIPLNSYTSDPIAILLHGDVDIAMSVADQVLINKDEGREIVAIGTVFNRSLACFMYKAGGVDTITDLRNKQIAVFKKFDTENILLALNQKLKLEIPEGNITQGGAVESFINDEVQVYGAYTINETIDMRLRDIAIETIDPSDYGIHFYSDTYITTVAFHELNPDVLKKFLEAANKGWQYAKKNPKHAIEMLFASVKNLTPTENGEKQSMALNAALKCIGHGPSNASGPMDKERWIGMEQELFNIRRISQTGYINDLCDFDMIQ